ncbi:MAG: dienelactone hydrolase family protein [Chitinispirillaceae bacterium]|nr:dienelactone hydrolase family protein [Chitinispirillaceae bacterium]
MKIKITKFILIIFLFILTADCSRKKSAPVSAEEIQDYFVNPSAEKLADLASRSPADTGLPAAAFRAARMAAGAVRVRLTDSAGLPYSLGYVTPTGMRRDTAYPLIIYLHGGIGTERSDKGDSAYLMLSALADSFSLFLASPSANRSAPWWSSLGLSRILQTLRFMTLHYPVNPGKVFLAGVSDGATGCYAAANAIPAPFAGFIAVSGFGGMLPMLGMRLEPGNLRQRPVYNVNGGLDHIYPAENVREFIRLMQEQGAAITSKIYPDEKHGFDYRAREMGALAGLVRAWSRPTGAVFSWTFVPGVPNLPDNLLGWTLSSDNASVKAFWRCSTLVVRARGVQSLTVSLPAAAPGERIVCRTSTDAGTKRVRTLSPLKRSRPRDLDLMVKRCFPETSATRPIYTIKF